MKWSQAYQFIDSQRDNPVIDELTPDDIAFIEAVQAQDHSYSMYDPGGIPSLSVWLENGWWRFWLFNTDPVAYWQDVNSWMPAPVRIDKLVRIAVWPTFTLTCAKEEYR